MTAENPLFFVVTKMAAGFRDRLIFAVEEVLTVVLLPDCRKSSFPSRSRSPPTFQDNRQPRMRRGCRRRHLAPTGVA